MAPQKARQYSLHSILLIVMLGALLLVIAGIGSLSLRRLQNSLDNAYRAQREFATTQLEVRTDDYFREVEKQSAVNRQLIADGVFSISDLTQIAGNWESVMRVELKLTSLSINLDASGEMLEVARLSNGRLSIRHLALDSV